MRKFLPLPFVLMAITGCTTTYVSNIGARVDNIEQAGGASYSLNTYKTALSGGNTFNHLVASKKADIDHELVQQHFLPCTIGDSSSFVIDGKENTYRYKPSNGACVASRKYKEVYWYPAQLLQPIALTADVVIVPFSIMALIFTL